MTARSQHRFSVDDYYRMAEAGVLAHDARVELLDGEIIDMSPIGPLHGSVTKRLIQLLGKAAGNRWLLAVQDPVRLDDHSEPQPDIALLRPVPDFYEQRHPQADDVYCLIEVSDTSLEADREQKLPAYGRAGVAEVWIVNLNDLVLEVYREPNFNGYGSKTVLRPGEVAHPQAFPDVSVEVGGLLRR